MAVGDLVTWSDSTRNITGEITALMPDFIHVVGKSSQHIVEVPPSHLMSQTVMRLTAEEPQNEFKFTYDDQRLIRLVETKQKVVDLYEDPKENPRLKTLLDFIEPISHKIIIWARFTKDIDFIYGALAERAVRYDGTVKTKDREEALERFRQDPSIQYFVANPAAISMGVTLTQAKTVIYYSNTFRLEQRLQSEDRAHRIGQDVSVLIVDVVARGTVDEHIVETLRKKFDLAATVTGDRLREWIR